MPLKMDESVQTVAKKNLPPEVEDLFPRLNRESFLQEVILSKNKYY